MSKDKTYRSLIHSSQWRSLRNNWLREHPYCEGCKSRGMRIGATEVHHIIPVETGQGYAEKERLMFNPTNLRSLCRECHHNVHRNMKTWSREAVKQRQMERFEAVMKTFFPGIEFEGVPGGGFLRREGSK